MLEALDRDLFLFLNGIHHQYIDQIMYWVSYKFTWIPFYLLLVVFLVKKHGLKFLIVLVPAIALLVTLTDQLSVHAFKNAFERYRPCHNLEIQHLVHLVSKCGGLYGFVSSHAANTFGIALFAGKLLNMRWVWGLLFWATVVSYSRIYLGVHYPSDIIGGALLGITCALLMLKITHQIKTRIAI